MDPPGPGLFIQDVGVAPVGRLPEPTRSEIPVVEDEIELGNLGDTGGALENGNARGE